MPTWPFFMLKGWNFHHWPLAFSFFKTQGSYFFKLNFDLFWPLCNIRNAFLHFSFYRAEIFTTVLLPALCLNTMVKISSNHLLTIFDYCATSKMAIFAIFHARNFKFSPQSPCFFSLKHMRQKIFKLTFDPFWPLCNIKNANVAIFHARKLEFSPQTPCLLFFLKKVVKIVWNWLLTTVQHKYANFAIFHGRELKFNKSDAEGTQCAVPTASLSLPKPQAWIPIVDWIAKCLGIL